MPRPLSGRNNPPSLVRERARAMFTCLLVLGVMPACGDHKLSTRDGVEAPDAASPDCEDCERPIALGECPSRSPSQPLELVEEWSWSGSEILPDHLQVMMTPMVANLTDDNGDGRVDAEDIPDVVFSTFAGSNYWGDGALRAVSGSDGSVLWPTSEPEYRTTPIAQVAIAELDAASEGPEILACSASNREDGYPGHLMLIGADGRLLRRFDVVPDDVPCGNDAPAVADVDGDRVPEIAVRGMLLHADGTLLQRFGLAGRGLAGVFTSFADLDGDGDLEFVAGTSVYQHTGSPLWTQEIGRANHHAVADLNLDGSPEVVAVVGGQHAIVALDGATGEVVWGPSDINPPELQEDALVAANPRGGGPPTIANFDEDPNPEIAFAGGFSYTVFEHDGSRKWFIPTTDRSSRTTGSSLFDFDGDGTASVLYNDETTFRVLHGPDGSLLDEQCNPSGTVTEYPIVVDVDNDGQAEIVLARNDYAFDCGGEAGTAAGVRVFRHPGNEWMPTRRIWNQHTYHVTNINEDASVPPQEAPNWRSPGLNNFRQNVPPEDRRDQCPDVVY